MKKSTQISKRTILFLSFLFSFTLAFSQPGTNVQKLQELANKFKTKWENQKTNAKAYSVRNNIPLRKVLNNGKIIELINVENDKPFYYTTNNINAAITTRTNELWTGGSLGLTLDGSSYNGLGIWDGGAVLTTHREFNNTGIARVIQSDGATSVSDHATHVSGTMIAGGVSTNAKGMAFNANLKAYDWTNDDAEMATAASNGLQISNHSYSYIHGWDDEGVWHGTPSVSTEEDYYFGFYSGYTSNWDEIAYNAPYYLIVKSAGNDRNDSGDGTYPPDGGTTGYDCIGTTGIAKNILTVGAVYDVLDYTGTAAVDMSSFSSWGPADDGRIKPDIVANGVGLYSSLGSATNSYGSYSGTSMSSPNAAGTLALLQQHYQNTHDGASMRAATLKALVIHTADEAGTSPGPDYKFGWGLINAEKAAELITADGNGKYNMDEQVLNNGETFSVDIQSAGTEPLVVSVVWTDPEHAALPAALDPPTPHLVNDLDLRLLNGGSTFYPYKLDVNNPSAPATNNTENNVDNVELVNISNPVAGTYTIQVDHDGTLAQPQQFSLVISGGEQITNEQITYAIIGDFGSGNSNETDVANLVKSWNPDFVVTTGDDRYGSTTFDLTIGRDYCEFLAGAGSGTYCSGNESPVNSFFPSTGNHEYTDGGGITEYLEYFDLPGDGVQSSGTSGSEKYYDFIQGPIHFFVIDSYDATTNGTLTTQQNWLQAQMTASNSIWKVVVFHHPPYSSSSNHGSTTAMRWPFAEWGADAVLNGHDHTYERLNAEGITYMVNGLGGMSKYDFGTPLPESIIQYSAEYGAQKVVADNNTMTFSFININNEIIDEVTLYKTNPPENNAPVFTSNPIVGKPEAEVGTNYSSSIDGDATDADNDQLIFSKVSGANWLNIASNGTLSGTPQNSDIGLNLIIVKVSDGKGGIAEAELQIIVNPAPAPPPSGTV